MQEMTHPNGFAWRFAEGVLPSELDALVAAFPDLDAVPGVRLIKRNHFRAVYEVPPGVSSTPTTSDSASGALLAKVYRYTSRWDRFRFRLIRARAEQEWVALSRFHELGLATARPVAVAVWRDGGRLVGGGLLASFLGGTEALGNRLHRLAQEAGGADATPNAEAAHILTTTGQYLRRLHDQGVWHRDLHAGNFLVSEDGEKVYLIDLHTCVFVGRLVRWQARRGVIKLLHSLQHLPREWLRLLLDAYGWGRLYSVGKPSQEEERLFQGAERLERKRLRSRSKRCFKPSTRFEVKHHPRGVRYYRLRLRDGAAWAASELESLYRPSPPQEVLKQDTNGWVARVPTPSGEKVCVKYRRLSLLESFQALVESHRLRRAYAAGHAFWVHHVPTPQVLALREHRTLGLVRESYLVTEFVLDALPLDQFLKKEYWGREAPFGDEARARHRLALRVGNLVRKVHSSGFYPHDFSPQNVLVTRQALVEDGSRLTGLQLVDLDHLYLWQPLFRRGRRKNLVQLGNLCEGHIGASDRLRALRAYCGGAVESPYCHPAWIRELDRRLLLEHRRVLDELVRQENEASQ